MGRLEAAQQGHAAVLPTLTDTTKRAHEPKIGTFCLRVHLLALLLDGPYGATGEKKKEKKRTYPWLKTLYIPNKRL